MAENPSSSPQGKVLQGAFQDSPVQGLEYRTPTLSGPTGPKGEFEYRAGETVTFSIGGLVIGAAQSGHHRSRGSYGGPVSQLLAAVRKRRGLVAAFHRPPGSPRACQYVCAGLYPPNSTG